MKIISFGDIHEDFSNLIPLKNELENADLVIVTGDLTNFHGRKEAEKVIEEIMKYNENILAQLGNLDQPEVNDYLTEKGINLHRNGFIRNDIGIFGVGGSNPTPFNTPTEFSEDKIETFLLDGIDKVRKLPLDDQAMLVDTLYRPNNQNWCTAHKLDLKNYEYGQDLPEKLTSSETVSSRDLKTVIKAGLAQKQVDPTEIAD